MVDHRWSALFNLSAYWVPTFSITLVVFSPWLFGIFLGKLMLSLVAAIVTAARGVFPIPRPASDINESL